MNFPQARERDLTTFERHRLCITAIGNAALLNRVIFDRSNRSMTSPVYPQLQTNYCAAADGERGHKRTLWGPRTSGIRIGSFAHALDKTLRQRSQRAILYCNEADWRGRRRDFDR